MIDLKDLPVNIADEIAGFAEAARKGKVYYYETNTYRKGLRPFQIKDVPVYYFGELFDKSGNDIAAWEQAVEKAYTQPLMLPYAQCIFAGIAKSQSAKTGRASGNVNLVLLLCSQPTRPGPTKMQVFLRSIYRDPLMAPAHIVYDDEWRITPGTAEFDIQEELINIEFFPGLNRREDVMTNFHEEFFKTINAVHVCVAAIHEPKTVRSTEAAGPKTTQVNIGRARAKLPPLAPVIKIDLNATLVPAPRATATGSGSEKRPHDRAGHWRTYKSGLRVYIKDQKIKGGRATPAIYDVIS